MAGGRSSCRFISRPLFGGYVSLRAVITDAEVEVLTCRKDPVIRREQMASRTL